MICAAHQTSCEVYEMGEAIGVDGVQEGAIGFDGVQEGVWYR